jgi:hypothetical protein
MEDPYHIPVVRSQLTRNIAALYDDIRDEVIEAFNDLIPVKDDDSSCISLSRRSCLSYVQQVWVKVQTTSFLQNAVCRISNRLFVGLPLCTLIIHRAYHLIYMCHLGRNSDWIELNIRYTIDAAIGAQILLMFPDFLRP